jgi:hypothetical protein
MPQNRHLLLCALGACLSLAIALPAALGAGVTQTTGVIHIAPDLEIVELQFGELQSGAGRPRFIPCTRIRLEPGRAYGWRMRVRTSRPEVRWQEELLLPRAPEQWGISQHVRLSSDRRRAVTTMSSAPVEGWIENFWWIADGDPPGAYELDVHVEGKRVGEMRFEVY